MKSSRGDVVEEPEEILEVLAQYWEELGKARTGESGVELGDIELESREDISDLCQEVGWQKVVGALKQLKRGKALRRVLVRAAPCCHCCTASM